MYTTKQWAKADPNVAGLLAAASGSAAAFKGRPGVGKSQCILAWARQLGYEPILLIGSTHPPEDFSGLPYVIEAQRFFEHVPARFLHRLSQPKAMCFLDELTTVPPQTRAGMLSMLSERMVGTLLIHPDTLFLSAYNPPEQAPNAVPLEMSVANRFYHSLWQHDRPAWRAGMVSEDNEFTPSWCPPRLPTVEEYKVHRPLWGEHIVNFTDRHSEMAETDPKDDNDYAYATPRSWKNLRDALCVAECVGAPLNIKRQLMDGFVGSTVGATFAKYINELDLIDVEEALANPLDCKLDKKRRDLVVSLLASTVTAVTKNYTPDRLEAGLILFVDNIANTHADLVSGYLKSLLMAKGEDKWTQKMQETIARFGKRFPDALKRRTK